MEKEKGIGNWEMALGLNLSLHLFLARSFFHWAEIGSSLARAPLLPHLGLARQTAQSASLPFPLSFPLTHGPRWSAVSSTSGQRRE